MSANNSTQQIGRCLKFRVGESSKGERLNKIRSARKMVARKMSAQVLSSEAVLPRALLRMQLLSPSQIATICENLKLEGTCADGQSAVETIVAWRDHRGDFEVSDEMEDEDHQNLLLDPNILPLYMEDVHESSLQFGLMKTDLQLECLLRNISYEASDTKSQLTSKLMDFKANVFKEIFQVDESAVDA